MSCHDPNLEAEWNKLVRRSWELMETQFPNNDFALAVVCGGSTPEVVEYGLHQLGHRSLGDPQVLAAIIQVGFTLGFTAGQKSKEPVN